MQIALDPYMFRRVPLTDLPALVADLGYSRVELSPREDFLPFFVHPRAAREQIAAFSTLGDIRFDGIATVCVFAWEDRARESSLHNLEQIRRYLAKHGGMGGHDA